MKSVKCSFCHERIRDDQEASVVEETGEACHAECQERGHVWHQCKPDCNGCMFCHGGLGLCTICKGFEGTVPSHCPGYPISDAHQELIYKGTLDFKDGCWTTRSRHRSESEDLHADAICNAVASQLNHEHGHC